VSSSYSLLFRTYRLICRLRKDIISLTDFERVNCGIAGPDCVIQPLGMVYVALGCNHMTCGWRLVCEVGEWA
jgi:hypothetical protein